MLLILYEILMQIFLFHLYGSYLLLILLLISKFLVVLESIFDSLFTALPIFECQIKFILLDNVLVIFPNRMVTGATFTHESHWKIASQFSNIKVTVTGRRTMRHKSKGFVFPFLKHGAVRCSREVPQARSELIDIKRRYEIRIPSVRPR